MLPREFGHNVFPSTCSSASIGPTQSLTELCDHPLTTPADSNPTMELIPAKTNGRAIEFCADSHMQQSVPALSEIKPRDKEKSIAEQTSPEKACLSANEPKRLITIPESPPSADFGVRTLLKPLPVCSESENSNTEAPLLFPSSSCPQQGLDNLQLPFQRSLVRRFPLIMSGYEESKEQLILDDSDSELEMSECSKNASYMPKRHSKPEQESQITPNNEVGGADSQVHGSGVLLSSQEPLPANEPQSSPSSPPPKRAKVLDVPTQECADSDSSAAGVSTNTHSKNDSQTVPNVVLLSPAEPLDTSEYTTPPIPDHSAKLEYPHEPVDVADDGGSTIDQMLPTERAREHAMVPNLVRCANEAEPNDDRDEPNDGYGSACLEAQVPGLLDLSNQETRQNQQANEFDDFVPGQTVVELETDIQVSQIQEDAPSQTQGAEVGSTDISTKDVHTTLVVPVIIESARQLTTEHQIVPEESFNPSPSSQSLYTDFHDKSEKHCSDLLDEGASDSQVDDPMLMVTGLESIDKRQKEAANLSHTCDQVLPKFPSQLSDCHTNDHGAGTCSSHELNIDEQRASRSYSEHSFGHSLFGFKLGKHGHYSQSK